MTENERLDAVLNTLCRVLERLPDPKKPETNPQSRFYNTFHRVADEHDKEFQKKYRDDLNATLVFAGLFSAVAAAFIVDIQQELRPNYNEMNFIVLTTLLNITASQANSSQFDELSHQLDPPVSARTKNLVINVQAILFCALTIALFAAFLATLGKQWLNSYAEGSLIDRSRHRELRMRGMTAWHFKYILGFLPVVMQMSLFLLVTALAVYMWDLSRTVFVTIATISAFGLLFYFVISYAATVWETCPYQTPLSLLLRYLISFARKHRSDGLQEIKGQLSGLATFWKHQPTTAGTPVAMELADRRAAEEPPTYPEEGSVSASDINCIPTMIRCANDPDDTIAAMEYILELSWTPDIQETPTVDACQGLRKSFELLKGGRALVRPGMGKQARASAKAFLYLVVQRRCGGARDDTRTVVTSLRPLLLGYQCEEDHELASTLQVIDTVINGSKAISWGEFAFDNSHYCWLSYVIRCRAWAVLHAHEPLPEEVSGFIRHSFSKDSLPSRVTADCLLIVNMIVSWPSEFDDKTLIKDRSAEIEDIINQIYLKIDPTLVTYSTAAVRERAIVALELMAPLKEKVLSVKSYELFRKMMAAALKELPTGQTENPFWRPAELLLSGAFKWHMDPPDVGDPADLIHLLEHCFSQNDDNARDEPVERAMLALGGATADELRGMLANTDFTEPRFFDGIYRALRNDAPYRLRRATVFFLRHLDVQFFDAGELFGEQAPVLVQRWSISAKESWDREHNRPLAGALVTTLMGLLNSTFWREHIPEERWDILRYISGLGGELPDSLRRCLRNSEIIPYLRDLRIPGRGKIVYFQWMAIMWMKYPDLSEAVQDQLKKETGEIAKAQANVIPVYLSLLEGEVKRDQGRIDAYDPWRFGNEVVELRTRHVTLLSARQILTAILKAQTRGSQSPN